MITSQQFYALVSAHHKCTLNALRDLTQPLIPLLSAKQGWVTLNQGHVAGLLTQIKYSL